jgi:hypothetical protein
VGNRAFDYEDIFCIFAGGQGADFWQRSGQPRLLGEHRRYEALVHQIIERRPQLAPTVELKPHKVVAV